MSGSMSAVIVIPIVVVVVIAVWIALVLRAGRRRPAQHGPGQEPSRRVAGGIFRGDRRQLMPNRYEPPPEADEQSKSAQAGTTPPQEDG